MVLKENNTIWINDICKNAIIEGNELRKKALQNPSDKSVRKYEEQRKLTNKTLRREKHLHEKKKIGEIEINRYNAKKLYEIGRKTEIDIETPKYEEIKNLIRKLKNNKDPRENSIVEELLKKGATVLVSKTRLKLIKTIWKTETIPEEWKIEIACPIFKKGNSNKTENYRGISLLDTYFKQAYDSVDREELWKALAILGIPKKYVNLIKTCYGKTLCRVRYLQGISDPLEVKSGLKQGDALSPALFNFALEKIIRDINDDRRMEISNEQVMLAYADDIMVMGETKEEVINSTFELMNASKGMGLHVYEEKIKYMFFLRRPPNIDSIQVANYKFGKVDNFKYLGVNINYKNDMHIEINDRISSRNR
ncbi:Reverse transcriptase domain [Cinara cedri]|uniref:Reverse transcriptase domain n=1 Tax=Cinara cedri TaxID=506608 RepID=A0A5E4MA39_9HEMI|nr:Reverse transcriptase domain [Cinara cedri]